MRDASLQRRGVDTTTTPGTTGVPEWGPVRRTAFLTWTIILSLLVGTVFVGVTALTLRLWLAQRNHDTNPVLDLGFFALGVFVVTTGLVMQLWEPEHNIAGLQQTVIGLLALGAAGLLGRRVEPLVGAIVLLAATTIVIALHPARRQFFETRTRSSYRLFALALLAVVPAAVYAAMMLDAARHAGPSCFLGQCAYGDRLAEMAALVIAVVIAAFLAAARPSGWRVPARSVGLAATIVGAASVSLPGLPGSMGQAGGTFAVVWGVLFVVMAEWEARA
jgi:hypothetical protein